MKQNFVLNYFVKNKLCSELQLFITRRFTPLIMVVGFCFFQTTNVKAQETSCAINAFQDYQMRQYIDMEKNFIQNEEIMTNIFSKVLVK